MQWLYEAKLDSAGDKREAEVDEEGCWQTWRERDQVMARERMVDGEGTRKMGGGVSVVLP